MVCRLLSALVHNIVSCTTVMVTVVVAAAALALDKCENEVQPFNNDVSSILMSDAIAYAFTSLFATHVARGLARGGT